MGPALLWLLGAGIVASIHGQPFPSLEKSPKVPPAPQDQLSEPTPAHHSVTPAITSFALHLYKQLAAEATGNICFSPVGVSAALALLSLGAQADTTTRILEGLGFNLTETPQADIYRGFRSLLSTLGQPSPKLELKVGTSLFLSQQLKPRQSFLDAARELYGALAFAANFSDAAGRRMEAFVRKRTYGRVAGIPGLLHDDTLLVLLNYVFFKAKWKHPFSRPHPQKPPLRVSTMHQQEMHRFLYDPELACTVLQLDFSGHARALLVLPDPGKMGQLEAALRPETLTKWGQSLVPSLLDLHLPRFSISGMYNLGDVLTHIFNLEADLSGIEGQLNQTILRMSHKAVLDMTERGTDAGVASSLLSQPWALNNAPLALSAISSAPLVHFNRPFLVFLWEMTTQSLLFLGKVANPTAG
ncbi:serpin A11-like [Erinaceus europaeus]|uniref:Serpin A11-like n=1 Tax=Erinaceus europaeus TaxID=9365 RepID=A0ABM3WK79_ERIEU|nr:serpin A11-like [Erinaceus europaeus]XP_016046295.2 serpin A11-like [Erinaceus europaeus]XP_060036973.1 serpin A11-like [Erinaceus europaeus]